MINQDGELIVGQVSVHMRVTISNVKIYLTIYAKWGILSI